MAWRPSSVLRSREPPFGHDPTDEAARDPRSPLHGRGPEPVGQLTRGPEARLNADAPLEGRRLRMPTAESATLPTNAMADDAAANGAPPILCAPGRLRGSPSSSAPFSRGRSGRDRALQPRDIGSRIGFPKFQRHLARHADHGGADARRRCRFSREAPDDPGANARRGSLHVVGDPTYVRLFHAVRFASRCRRIHGATNEREALSGPSWGVLRPTPGVGGSSGFAVLRGNTVVSRVPFPTPLQFALPPSQFCSPPTSTAMVVTRSSLCLGTAGREATKSGLASFVSRARA